MISKEELGIIIVKMCKQAQEDAMIILHALKPPKLPLDPTHFSSWSQHVRISAKKSVHALAI